MKSGSSNHNNILLWNHKTKTGHVVYKRKKHTFNGRDLTRIVTAVNNNNSGSALNWRYVNELSSRWVCYYVLAGMLPTGKENANDYKSIVDRFNELFKSLSSDVLPVLRKLPGFFGMLNTVSAIYSEVKHFLDSGNINSVVEQIRKLASLD